jgi:hypothetical protein
MKKLSLVFIFSFVVLLCNAQQKLFIEKISNGKIKSVVLPAEVYIEFKNGGYEKLLLQKIVGDSLFFKKYYNQPQNYDCTIGEVSHIYFPKKSDELVQTTATFFTGMALFITPLTIVGFFPSHSDDGGSSLTMAIILGIPMSAISIISSAALIRKLPKNFNTRKWRIYVK